MRVRDTGIGIAPDMLPHGLRPVRPGGPRRHPVAGRAGDRADAGEEPGRDARRDGRGPQRGAGPGERVRRPAAARGHGGGCRRRPAGPAAVPHLTPHPATGCWWWTTTGTRPRAWPCCCGCTGTRSGWPTTARRPWTAARGFRPAAVFLDLGMPGMDGYEVARRLRRQPGLEGVVLVGPDRLGPGGGPPPLGGGGVRPPPGQAGGPGHPVRPSDRAAAPGHVTGRTAAAAGPSIPASWGDPVGRGVLPPRAKQPRGSDRE